MEKIKCSSLSFRDLSIDESANIFGGTSFAYDAGRAIRFLVISAQGTHGPTMAIADWVGNTFLES
jgi:hypothetical protein